MTERWKVITERLELLASGPSDEQREVAAALGIDLGGVPAPVAVELIKARLAPALMTKVVDGFELPEEFRDLEKLVGVSDPAQLHLGTRAEISAWYAARYMILTAKGLRNLKPHIGDVVSRLDAVGEHMVVSSISDDGAVYMKGGLGKRSWPNYLAVIARNDGSTEHKELVAAVDASLRNGRTKRAAASTQLDRLEEFRVASRHPSPEALRELEDLLESGEPDESPFQSLIERQPEILASLVHGNWATYVIPQKRLGSEYVTDFLVLGVSSLGPEWMAVELEAPRHELLTMKGRLRSPVQHAVDQIQDWREWLTTNVAYAQDTLNLVGLTNKVPGLVVVGRADPAAQREPARARLAEEERIHVHSWDWLLRETRRIVEAGHQGRKLSVEQ